MKRWLWVLCFALGALLNTLFAQTFDTVRIATYNVLDYSGSTSDTTARNPEFRRVLRAIDPDILIIEEVTSSNAATGFMNNVLNAGRPNTYGSAPFSDGYDTDNSMFFKAAKFSFIGPQTVLHTALRDINGYRLRPVGITADSLDIQIYAAHLKASQGYEAQRGAEAETLRTHLNSLTPGNFIAGGDFNLYTSTEDAFQNLTESRSNNNGRLYDPINTSGNWHDGSSFAGIHTQSTRSSEGGMDDRFDFLLLSYGFQSLPGWEYVTGSYTEFGNDGQHFNQAINVLPNHAVPDSIANALEAASDHVPVFLQVRRQLTSAATITLLSPNGSESWMIGQTRTLSWNSSGVFGNVRIELNRSFPSSSWEILFGSAVNDGSEPWLVTAPVTNHARMRIYSVNTPAVGDTSNADFSIVHSLPPVVVHDRHADALPGVVTFTAKVTDDYPGVSCKLFYRAATNSLFDSLTMNPTVYPDEFSASPVLSYGRWVYFIRATDSEGQTTSTDVLALSVTPACGLNLSYDDGSAEVFNWAPADSVVWAVRFTPAQIPFALSSADVSIAAFHPDSTHSPIRVRVYSTDGPAGMPGTLLREVIKGSIGNIIGGFPAPGGYSARIALSDDSLPPLLFNSDFYVAVLNGPTGVEAFGLDTSSAFTGRSVVYNACAGQWYADDGQHSGSRRGNRMIRAQGWAAAPLQLIIERQEDNAHLHWNSSGAAYYKVYKSLNGDFGSAAYLTTTADTSLVLTGEFSGPMRAYYSVVSSSTP